MVIWALSAIIRPTEFISAFVVIFNLIISIGFSCRLDIIKCQHSSKPWTLAVIVGRHLDIEHTLEMKQIKLTTLTFGLLLFGCNEDY
jgi:hypothetical protein